MQIENPELLKAFRQAAQNVRPYLLGAMQDVVFIIQGELGYTGYAPSSEANLPGRFDKDGEPMGYYERGRGWWYPVKNASTLGGVNGVGAGVQDVRSAYKRHKMKTKDIPFSERVVIRPGKTTKRNNMIVEQEVVYVKERTDRVAGYKLAKNANGERGTSELLGKSWTTNVTSGEDFIAGEVGTPVSYADYVQGFNVTDLHKSRGWLDMDERLDKVMPQIEKRFDMALEDYLSKFGEE